MVAVIGLVSGGTTYGTGYAEARGLVEGTASALRVASVVTKSGRESGSVMSVGSS